MATQSFDLCILGGGPGGYVAAIRARQLGMSVALVEREHLGGICLNWGCIPTKALLRTAEIRHLLSRLGEFGLSAKDIGIDWARVIGRSREVSAQLAKGVKHLMKKHGVTVFEGHGKLNGKHAVSVRKGPSRDDAKIADIAAPHILLATGARPRVLPGLEPDGSHVWTYREAMVADALPASLLVVGAGAIGIEFASFYHQMGARVTVVEAAERILPVEDEEVSSFMQTTLEKQGIAIRTGTTVKTLEKGKKSLKATLVLPGGKTEECQAERTIIAAGIVGNTENLGLEGTQVLVEKTHIVTDEWLATDEPGVYAIGDLAGPPWLAHKASHEGILCVEKIAGVTGIKPLRRDHIPGCTYSLPQVASIGLTEAQAKAGGRAVKTGRFPLSANGKAIALGETAGFVKTIFDANTGELLGAHLAGPEVTELIQGFAIGKTLEATEADLMHTIFPHPTLSEAMHESILAAYGRALHV